MDQALHADVAKLLDAMVLRELRAIQAGDVSKAIGEVLCELGEVKSMIARAHNAEMQKIDVETTALGQQITEIAAGMTAPEQAEQARRLNDLAARLGALGKVEPAPTP